MVSNWHDFELPCGIEAAAFRFAAAVERDGYKSAALSTRLGDVAHLSLFEHDGTQHYLKIIGSDWCELVEVDEEVGTWQR